MIFSGCLILVEAIVHAHLQGLAISNLGQNTPLSPKFLVNNFGGCPAIPKSQFCFSTAPELKPKGPIFVQWQDCLNFFHQKCTISPQNAQDHFFCTTENIFALQT